MQNAMVRGWGGGQLGEKISALVKVSEEKLIVNPRYEGK